MRTAIQLHHLSKRYTRTTTTSQRCLSFSISSTNEPFYGKPREAPKPTQTPILTNLSPHNQQQPSPPLSFTQRLGVSIHSALTALSDPTRADAVAALGEVTGQYALQRLYDEMMSHPTGQIIVRDKPLVNSSTIDLEVLGTMEEGTFGKAYAEFMKGHGFDPDERDLVRFVSDPELAYVMLRYRQCHDFWHTLTGLPPTVAGEIALKWLELFQTNLPVAALSATVGTLRLSDQERHDLQNVYLPWAIRVGTKTCKVHMMNVYYEEEFESNLEELRERLGIEVAPDTTASSL